MKEFWEHRFIKEGTIWSNNPSKSAIYAAAFFQNYPIQNIMILGIGYGRNSRPFIEKGYDVSGIEISEEAIKLLNNSGLLFFTVMSEFDIGYGKGTEIEYNTFDKRGKPVHYFTESDIKNHFGDFKILETKLIDEPEEHGNLGKHVHKCRLIIALKI
jgi:hypothetical protein